MVTLSPFLGTCKVSQFPESPQLVPSPFPVHVGSEEALAAIGASVLPTIAPAVAATASPDRSQQPDHPIMITPMARGRIPIPPGSKPDAGVRQPRLPLGEFRPVSRQA